jgi:hypothetical protein
MALCMLSQFVSRYPDVGTQMMGCPYSRSHPLLFSIIFNDDGNVFVLEVTLIATLRAASFQYCTP